MGYVPPKGPTSAELIRQDLMPTLARLYAIYSYSEFGTTKRSGYRGYVDDLYGGRKSDHWFLFLNYTLLAAIIALALVLGAVIVVR